MSHNKYVMKYYTHFAIGYYDAWCISCIHIGEFISVDIEHSGYCLLHILCPIGARPSHPYSCFLIYIIHSWHCNNTACVRQLTIARWCRMCNHRRIYRGFNRPRCQLQPPKKSSNPPKKAPSLWGDYLNIGQGLLQLESIQEHPHRWVSTVEVPIQVLSKYLAKVSVSRSLGSVDFRNFHAWSTSSMGARARNLVFRDQVVHDVRCSEGIPGTYRLKMMWHQIVRLPVEWQFHEILK